MKKLGLRHLILIFFLTGLFWAALSQISSNLFSQTKEKPLQYEVEVVLIEIPLYVVDKKGNPVKDLKPEEVTLYENGKKQIITHFVLVQNDSPEIASVVREYPAARRQFLLFFDFAFTTPGKIARAREACLNFIKESILPNDLVAVATYSTMGGLKILAHFTNDREQLFNITNTIGLVKSKSRMIGSLTPEAEKQFMEVLKRAEKKTERIYHAYVTDFVSELNKLSIALNNISGRKHIIYFSEGFDSKVLTGKSLAELSKESDDFMANKLPSVEGESRFGDTALRMKLYDVLRLISSADCPIHSVDIGGLRTQAGQAGQFEGGAREPASIRRGQDTLTVFSRETGGQVYKNVNELDLPLKDLLKITNAYYIVGYSPVDTKKAGRFRKIKLKTDRSGVSISYRKGYYEEKPYKNYSILEKRLQLVEYISKDIPRSDIQFDSFVSAFPGNEGICQVPIFLKFPGRQFLNRKKKIELEIYGYAISSSGVFRDFFHQTITISPQKVKKKLELSGFKYFNLHLVPPGDYKIRLIARDARTGEIGSQTQEITVPDYSTGNLALSGPVFIPPESEWILSRGYDPNAPTGRKMGTNLPLDYPYVLDNKPFIPGVAPVLQRSLPAEFYLRVHNLRLHPQTKAPQTELSFEIVDMEGKSTLFGNVGFVKAPSQPEPGVFELLFQANFENLETGFYQLKLSFKDSLANQEIVAMTPFVLQ